MSTEELKVARKVRHTLDRGTAALDPGVLARLQEGRRKALDRQRVAVGGLSLAGIGNFASFRLPAYARTTVAAFALLAGVVGTYYWNSFEQAAENAEIDSALLSDELPPAAYLDKGFQAWLERTPQSPQ
ncbi:MAG TPA: DUF3619 family protein [Rhodocyclaceae bacterium]